MPSIRRLACVSLVLVFLLAGTHRLAAAPAAGGSAAKPSDVARRRTLLTDYYLELYGMALTHSDWVTRAMAVLGLAKIDDPRVTDLLLETMERPFSTARARAKRAALQRKKGPPVEKKMTTAQRIAVSGAASSSGGADASNIPAGSAVWRVGNNVVQVMAWEALHARTPSLTAAQRKRWLAATVALGQRGMIRGSMRETMLRLLAEQGPTPNNMKLFWKLFTTTNALYPGDVGTLQAMRGILGKWHSEKLTRALIVAMGKGLDDGPRADYLLRGLGSEAPDISGPLKGGTDGLWPGMQRLWTQWYKKQEFGKAETLPPYKGLSKLIAKAEVIEPGAAKWRKDLELPKLRLDQLDVMFLVDSTGSMKPVVNWIKRDVRKMLSAFALLSREPRIGVIFYRDHGDEYVTKAHNLSGDGRRLTRAIEDTTAAGGGDVPEAVYDAIGMALTKQRWSRSQHACRAIILVGDAPPHDKDLPKVEAMVQTAGEKGFRFFCIKARTRYGSDDLSAFDRIAEWGKGKSVWVDFREAKLHKEIYEGAAHVDVLPGAGGFDDGGKIEWDFAGSAGGGSEPVEQRPDRVILREVFRSILAEAYADRVDAFTNVLLEYLEMPIKEKRLKMISEAERRARRERRDAGGGGRKVPAKPKGPQDR